MEAVYDNLSCKALTNLCKERGMKYITKMNKTQMISILKQNDVDPNIIVNQEVQSKAQRYIEQCREKPEYREKERHYKRIYDIINKDKVEAYHKEYRARKYQV